MFASFFTSVGVDISEHHIRFVRASRFGQTVLFCEIPMPDGAVVDEQIVQVQAVQEVIQKGFIKLSVPKFARVVVLVPESRVFSTSFASLDVVSLENTHLFLSRAQKHIPVPFDHAFTDVVQSRQKFEKGFQTTVFALEKHIQQAFIDVFSQTNTRIVSVLSPASVLFSQIIKTLSKNTSLVGVVDIGTFWISLSLFTKEGIQVFSRAISLLNKTNQTKDALSEETVDSLFGMLEDCVLYFEQQKQKIDFFVFAGSEAQNSLLQKQIKKQPSFSIKFFSEFVSRSALPVSSAQPFGAAYSAAIYAFRHRSTYSFPNFFI